jgi:DNA-binding transcriptional MerR regulator
MSSRARSALEARAAQSAATSTARPQRFAAEEDPPFLSLGRVPSTTTEQAGRFPDPLGLPGLCSRKPEPSASGLTTPADCLCYASGDLKNSGSKRSEDDVEGTDFLEYLELQGDLDLVSKSELLEAVRERGARVSPRQLTSYITEGLVPRSARIGSRSGAFPKIITDLLTFVAHARDRGLSFEAIKELLPLWRLLYRGIRDQRIDLLEFEYSARQHVRKPEAIFSVPWVFEWLMPCPIHDAEDYTGLTFVFKDTTEHTTSDAEPLTLGFLIASKDDEEGCTRNVAWMRVVLSPLEADDPSAVVLGIPNGASYPASTDEPVEVSKGSASKHSRSPAHETN